MFVPPGGFGTASYESLALSVAQSVHSAALPIPLDIDDDPQAHPQPRTIRSTVLKNSYPVWYLILVDADDFLLDVAFARPYGGWLDLNDRQTLYVLCRDTLAEIHQFYITRQLTLPLGDRRPPESGTLSTSKYHFND